MNYIALFRLLMPLIIKLVRALKDANTTQSTELFELDQEVTSLSNELDEPRLLNFLDFLKNVDVARLVAAIRELVAVIRSGLGDSPQPLNTEDQPTAMSADVTDEDGDSKDVDE